MGGDFTIPGPIVKRNDTHSCGFVLCVRNGGYRASLEPRKVYRTLPDPGAEARALVRVIDESGKDDLFPADSFVPIEVPSEAVVVLPTET